MLNKVAFEKDRSDQSSLRSDVLLAVVALLLYAAVGLVYSTATRLSQSDGDQGGKIGFDRRISENAQQMRGAKRNTSLVDASR